MLFCHFDEGEIFFDTSFGFPWHHRCELVLFIFIFNKKKKESILSSVYLFASFIKANYKKQSNS
jgi:hypothetical protein